MGHPVPQGFVGSNPTPRTGGNGVRLGVTGRVGAQFLPRFVTGLEAYFGKVCMLEPLWDGMPFHEERGSYDSRDNVPSPITLVILRNSQLRAFATSSYFDTI